MLPKVTGVSVFRTGNFLRVGNAIGRVGRIDDARGHGEHRYPLVVVDREPRMNVDPGGLTGRLVALLAMGASCELELDARRCGPEPLHDPAPCAADLPERREHRADEDDRSDDRAAGADEDRMQSSAASIGPEAKALA